MQSDHPSRYGCFGPTSHMQSEQAGPTNNRGTLDHHGQHSRVLLCHRTAAGRSRLPPKSQKCSLFKGLEQGAHHQRAQIYHQPIHPLLSTWPQIGHAAFMHACTWWDAAEMRRLASPLCNNRRSVEALSLRPSFEATLIKVLLDCCNEAECEERTPGCSCSGRTP